MEAIQTKPCTLCGEEKAFSEFNKHPKARFFLHPRCRECQKAQKREFYKANPEKWKEYEAQLRAKDPEGLKKKNRDAATRWRASPENQSRKRMKYIEKEYGIKYEQFEAMEREQGGLCKICRRPPNGRWDRLHIDHDHNTKSVRGLLCHACNTGLGKFEDRIDWLQAAAEYLTPNTKA